MPLWLREEIPPETDPEAKPLQMESMVDQIKLPVGGDKQLSP
jgi:hypothetical protein